MYQLAYSLDDPYFPFLVGLALISAVEMQLFGDRLVCNIPWPGSSI